MGLCSQGMGNDLSRGLRSSVMPMGNPDRVESLSFPSSTAGESRGCFAWLQMVDDCTQSQIVLSYPFSPREQAVMSGDLKAVISVDREAQQDLSPFSLNSLPGHLHRAGSRLLQLLQLLPTFPKTWSSSSGLDLTQLSSRSLRRLSFTSVGIRA